MWTHRNLNQSMERKRTMFNCLFNFFIRVFNDQNRNCTDGCYGDLHWHHIFFLIPNRVLRSNCVVFFFITFLCICHNQSISKFVEKNISLRTRNMHLTKILVGGAYDRYAYGVTTSKLINRLKYYKEVWYIKMNRKKKWHLHEFT